MTHPVVHFLIPVILLLLLKFNKELVLLLSPLALLPDLDYFIPPHRGWGHSIFFAALLIILAYFALRKRFPAKQILAVASIMVLSHLVLDGDMGWLYPLSDARFGYRWDLGRFVWNDTVSAPREYFSDWYKAIQVAGILIAASLIYLFWPSSARPRSLRSPKRR